MNTKELLSQIPEGRENSISREELCRRWNCSDRQRRINLELLQQIDIGHRVIIRSGKGCGIYISTDNDEVAAYRQEILNKGRSILAGIRQCNRFLDDNMKLQIEFSEVI